MSIFLLSIRVVLSEILVGRVIDGKYPELRIHSKKLLQLSFHQLIVDIIISTYIGRLVTSIKLGKGDAKIINK